MFLWQNSVKMLHSLSDFSGHNDPFLSNAVDGLEIPGVSCTEATSHTDPRRLSRAG